jgi:hypothetical protein
MQNIGAYTHIQDPRSVRSALEVCVRPGATDVEPMTLIHLKISGYATYGEWRNMFNRTTAQRTDVVTGCLESGVSYKFIYV